MIVLPRKTVRHGVALLISAIASMSSAQAAVPPDIAGRIDRLAASWRASDGQQRQMAALSGDNQLSGVAMTLNRQVSASLISQAVMDAMERDPADAADAVALAVRSAPALETPIKTRLVRAYPALADTINAAGHAPATPVKQAAPAPAATAPPESAEAAGNARDPAEGVNRAVFAFNDFLDSYLIAPVARVYRWIMPATLREMGRNFFENLDEPVVAINDALQGDFDNAGTSVSRFAINSTIGILGFFEVAERVDLPQHPADFGQTLNSYGVGAGPYLVLPVLGRSTARDAVGDGVDFFLNPFAYFLGFETWLYTKAAEGFVNREARLDETEKLRKTPPDYYSAARDAWLEKRALELRKLPTSEIERREEGVKRAK